MNWSQLKPLSISLFLIIVLSCSSKACISVDSSIVWIRVNYIFDTTGGPLNATISEIEIRLTNIRLMNENPNKVCSCALTRYSSVFSNLLYVAFVDSGTSMPYQGFASWNQQANASTAWNAAEPGFGWEGYIAKVVNSGLVATEPVEFIIRAAAPAGQRYTLFGDTTFGLTRSLDSAITSEFMGTDEWDPISGTLMGSHRGIKDFSNSNIQYTEVDSAYFTNLDSTILNNIPSRILPRIYLSGIKLYPNPTKDHVKVHLGSMSEEIQSIVLLDCLGKTIREYPISLGNNKVNMLDVQGLEPGLYLLNISSQKASETRRLRLL